MTKITRDAVRSAMEDFFQAWRQIRSVPWVYPKRPTAGNVGIDPADWTSMDGSFDANELAQHVADALNGCPRDRFSKLSKEVISAMERDDSLTEYEKKWERDGTWLMGPTILTQIVTFLRDKHLVATADSLGAINIAIPLPDLRDEISGNMVSISHAIPDELVSTFDNCCSNALNHYNNDMIHIEHEYRGKQVTELALEQINYTLYNLEIGRKYRQELELWQVVGIHLGIIDPITRTQLPFPRISRSL